MKTEVSVCIKVPDKAYEMFSYLSSQNENVRFVCLFDNEVMFTGDMLDIPSDLEDEDWEDIADFEDFPF